MISIIIPVYNRESYIEKCVKSVLSQSYSDFELIVIDDGSTDSTPDIVDSLAGTDSRIIAVHQKNGGVSAARQTGIEIAKGDWISFLDSDDTLPADALLNYSKVLDTQADIIVSGVQGQLNTKQFLLGMTDYTLCPTLWGKLFKSQFLKDKMPFLPRELVMGEDMIANLVLGMESGSFATIPEVQYNVTRDNDNSVTKTFKRTFPYELFFFKTLDDMCLSKCTSLSYYDQLLYNVNILKMNNYKTVVLDGNSIDINSEEWLSFVSDLQLMGNSLGPSDKLFLKMSKHQKLYRVIMNTYLRYLYPLFGRRL